MESSDQPIQETIQTRETCKDKSGGGESKQQQRKESKASASPGRMTLDGSAGLKSKVSIPDVFRDIACN